MKKKKEKARVFTETVSPLGLDILRAKREKHCRYCEFSENRGSDGWFCGLRNHKTEVKDTCDKYKEYRLI
jgi:hypothetical protein